MVLILLSILAVIAITLALYGGRISNILDPVSMYRVACSLVVASILSGVISFFSIAYSLSGVVGSNISFQEAVVEILGVLVTVLMGWNIISLVDFKKKADEIDNIKHDFKHVIGGFMQLNFDSFLMKGEKHELLDNCFTALEEVHSCQNESIRKMSEDKLMDLIKRVCDGMGKNNDKLIMEGKKKYYIHTLKHIDSKYVQEIEEFLNDAVETEQKYDSDVKDGAAKIPLSSGINSTIRKS